MFSRAGSTRTQIAGRQSLGMNLSGRHKYSSHIVIVPNKVNLLASVEKYKPSCNREEWQEELARNREKERDEK